MPRNLAHPTLTEYPCSLTPASDLRFWAGTILASQIVGVSVCLALLRSPAPSLTLLALVLLGWLPRQKLCVTTDAIQIRWFFITKVIPRSLVTQIRYLKSRGLWPQLMLHIETNKGSTIKVRASTSTLRAIGRDLGTRHYEELETAFREQPSSEVFWQPWFVQVLFIGLGLGIGWLFFR